MEGLRCEILGEMSCLLLTRGRQFRIGGTVLDLSANG
jgi:hypothetical protein